MILINHGIPIKGKDLRGITLPGVKLNQDGQTVRAESKVDENMLITTKLDAKEYLP